LSKWIERFLGQDVIALSQGGHCVAWVFSDATGSSNGQGLKHAQDENPLSVTFDKDFAKNAVALRPVESAATLL
jgi:hypothetical protein